MKPLSLCVLGNSHTAAIKQGWGLLKPKMGNDIDLRFFAAGNSHIGTLYRSEKMLLPGDRVLRDKLRETSGGEGRIDIDAYDGFLLIGLKFGIDVTKLCDEMGTSEDLRAGPVSQLVSEDCFAATLHDQFCDCLSIRFAREIRAVSRAPILIFPVPFPSEHVHELPDAPAHPALRDASFLGRYVARCKRAAESAAEEVDGDIVWQDEFTTALPGFTMSRFSIGAARINPKNEVEGADAHHMNAEYGALMLERGLRLLERSNTDTSLADTRSERAAASPARAAQTTKPPRSKASRAR